MLTRHEGRRYSQHGEDGVIEWLLPYAGHDKRIVEIGCGTDEECQATNLVRHHGFSSVLLDAKRGQHITAENVNDYVLGPITVLSIDVDGNDYWIWKAIKAQPDIVCIEYNNLLHGRVTIPYDPNFVWKKNGHWFRGASLEAMIALGNEKGYQFIGAESSHTNAFFIRRGLGLPDLSIDYSRLVFV